MNSTNEITSLLIELHLSKLKDSWEQLLTNAVKEQPSYSEFLRQCLNIEVSARHQKSLSIRMKQAKIPYEGLLKDFDFGFQTSVSKRQIDTLKEMHWLKDAYNLILLGPPGIGKTHLARNRGTGPLFRLIASYPS
ncbi:MAG: ATP-binding protein [Veillonellaceae bacterium]|nr:ATP-binding protein [Veillonellaceae bacterium]